MKTKKLTKIIVLPLLMMLFVSLTLSNVFAASFSIKASSSKVSPGGSFTVTVSAPGAGQFSFSASNGTVSTSQGWVEGSYKFTVTAGQSGTTTVTVSAVDATGNDETPITGNKSLSVSIGQSGGSSGGSNTPAAPDTRSKDNNLSSLAVSEGTLSPAFAEGTTSYKVELTSDIKKVTVDAKAKDSKAKVTGTGETELKVGENNISIVVTAENGAKKTYTVSVYVTEKPTQFLKMNNKDFGILNDFSKTDLPKGFSESTASVDGKDVKSLVNEKMGITLLLLQNPDGANGFYIYDGKTVTQEYQPLIFNDKIYAVIGSKEAVKDISGVKEGKIKIGELEVNGWVYTDKEMKNYALVYLVNEEGEKSLYTYELTEGTLQKYPPQKSSQMGDTVTYVFIGTTVAFAAASGVLAYLYFNFKKKSISAIKDYYDSKNQG